MKSSIRQSICVVSLLLSSAALADVKSSGTAQDIADVQNVLDTFHRAVVSHNGSQLAALFIPEGSTWLNVLSADAYSRAQAKSPSAAKVRLGSYQDFAKFVSNTPADLDPKHTHIQIHTDGTIAAVYFDFVFLISGREQNRGSETWQLVKGAEGWRIAALTYSSTPHQP